MRETPRGLCLTIAKILWLRYPDDVLSKKNLYVEQRVSQIYIAELQLNKANYFDTECLFWDSILFTANGIVISNIYDKQDDFSFKKS